MSDHDLRCICGSNEFTQRTTSYRPAKKLTDRLLGRADAAIAGVCARCSTHVSTNVYSTRRETGE